MLRVGVCVVVVANVGVGMLAVLVVQVVGVLAVVVRIAEVR